MKAFSSLFCAMAICALSAAGGVAAQDGAIPRAAAYGELARLPDWGGVWQPDWSAIYGEGGRPTPKLLPAAQAEYDAFIAAQEEGRNVQGADANCLPPGMPRIMQMPYPLEFLFSPGRVTILAETYSQVRRIYTDGRQLPEDPDPFFNGHSVGHWEGDTLVVDTAGFSPLTIIAPGVEHSDKMIIHERFWLERPDRLIAEITITDPEVLDGPFVIRQPYDRKDEWEIREYVCQENNRDASDAQGRASIDLGLDGDGGDPFGPLEEEGE